jgi:hypothetical protein
MELATHCGSSFASTGKYSGGPGFKFWSGDRLPLCVCPGFLQFRQANLQALPQIRFRLLLSASVTTHYSLQFCRDLPVARGSVVG